MTFLEQKGKEKISGTNSTVKHARCCKDALPKGLCKAGGPLSGIKGWMTGTPEDCVVCVEIWHSGHGNKCPRDSGKW